MGSEERRRRIEDVLEDIRHASYTVPAMKEKGHPDYEEMRAHLKRQIALYKRLILEEQEATP